MPQGTGIIRPPDDQEEAPGTTTRPLGRGVPHATLNGMDDRFLVACPYCGEQVEIYVEPDVRGSFVQDCEVCCQPWRVDVAGRGDERDVRVSRADGSE